MTINTPDKLKQYEKELGNRNSPALKTEILVSMGTCGIAAGTTPVLDALKKEPKNKTALANRKWLLGK